ncbi:MAG: hypothetical protein K0U68_15630 [Gammaproteobacteria bacterium]|nr:hypothetical protein [Gammaproteobacteria bacterium]
MKTSYELLISFAVVISTAVIADETISEKIQAKANDLKRSASKTVNRVEEAVCTGSEVECMAQKAANRAEEVKQTVEDKTTAVKNKVDSD